MKHLFFVILIASLFTACAGKSTSESDATKAVTAVANKTVTLAIDGMTCTGCEGTIQDEVSKIAGITEIKASHVDSLAVVSFDSTLTNVEAIGDVITAAGYQFKGVKATTSPAIAQ